MREFDAHGLFQQRKGPAVGIGYAEAIRGEVSVPLMIGLPGQQQRGTRSGKPRQPAASAQLREQRIGIAPPNRKKVSRQPKKQVRPDQTSDENEEPREPARISPAPE